MTAATSVTPKAGQYNSNEYNSLSDFEEILSDDDVPF